MTITPISAARAISRSVAPEGTMRAPVVVLSSQALARRGLLAMLSELGIAGRAATAAASVSEACELAAATGSSIIAIDANAMDSASLQAICRNLLETTDCRLVVIADAANVDTIQLCFDAGVSAWVLSDSDDIVIATAFDMARQGQRYIDPRAALISRTKTTGHSRPPTPYFLTRREREVLQLLQEGCSNRAISARLTITEATTKGHVSSILAKLGVESRLAAALMALDVV